MALLTIGCGQSLIPSVSSVGGEGPLKSSTLGGQVHGGNQLIVGAVLDLYSVGTTGYGSAGTHLATTTSDSSGIFTFSPSTTGTPGPTIPISATYTCPSAGTQLYITSRGGATQGIGNGTNAAAAFIVAIGPCSSAASVYVNMNEVTSTATMAALQQYFNPVTETFGTPSTTQAQLGYANNVTLISNMVYVPTGSALPSSTHTATPLGHGSLAGSSVTVTATPEVLKINTVADILAACVNNTARTATNCTTLFNNATPPDPTVTSQPTADYSSITSSNEDTLQALYFMMTNPTSTTSTTTYTSGVLSNTGTTANTSATHMAALFGLVSAAGSPFNNAYATSPTDWTIAITYSSTSTCNSAVGSAYPSGAKTTTSSESFLEGGLGLSIDAKGNVWGATYNSASTGTGNLFQISNVGTPLTCGLGSGAYKPSSIVIDPDGYVWINTQQTISSNYYLYKWNPTLGDVDSSWNLGTIAAQGVAIDGSGNVFYAQPSAASGATSSTVKEFPLAGVAGASPTTITVTTIITGMTGTNPQELVVDSSGNLFAAQFTTTASSGQEIDYIYPNGGSYSYLNIADSNSKTARGLAIGQTPTGTSVETVNLAGGTWQSFVPPATTGSAPTLNFETTPSTFIGGLVSPTDPHGVAVDGASNVWANCTVETGNYVTVATGTLFGLCEISATGKNLSPTFVTSGKTYGGFQKTSAFLPSAASSVAIDIAGNVWVGQHTNTETQITQLVGQAVPVVTPISVAVGAGTLGTKP